MNRIDHRPAALQPDGAQLQRRMLQDLERQWLDSWGAASAAQPGAMPASPENQTPAPASQGFSATADAGLSTPDRQAAASPAAERPKATSHDAADGASHEATGGAARPDRAAAHDTEREPLAPADAAVVRRFDTPAQIAETATPGAEAGPTGVMAGASAIASAGFSPPELVPAASTAIALKATTAVAPGLAFASPATPPEPDAEHTAAPRRRTPPAAADGDFGRTKLTLRELAPDLVQATLRDAQLSHAASQLAAQGLARALMEAGYAQARVVVNGQHGQGGRAHPDDAAAAPAAAPSDTFPATAPQDRIHGH
jgi:hypothetical protein